MDLRVVFKAKRLTTARALAEEFADPESPSLHYRGRFKKAVAVFEAGLDDALSFLAFPSGINGYRLEKPSQKIKTLDCSGS